MAKLTGANPAVSATSEANRMINVRFINEPGAAWLFLTLMILEIPGNGPDKSADNTRRVLQTAASV